ncbi:MAG: DUF2612 domain-containing protein [Rhodocyclaceae bacterium]
MIDVEQTIISQYANSATISQLVRNMNTYLDPRADFDTFFDYVWNVESAQGFGLDIWGRIVGISRELLIPASPDFFGFNEATGSAHSFNESPFYDGTPPATSTYKLADDAYRQLILVKALANISATNAPAINQLLQNMFAGRGRCYVNDLGGMALRYTFEFDLTPYEFAIMTQSDALPRPAGVNASLFQSALPLFGFSEAGLSAAPFGQGVFVPQGAINAAN